MFHDTAKERCYAIVTLMRFYRLNFFEIKLSCEELKQNKKPGIDPLIQHQAFFKIYFKKFYVTKMP